jgi:hypothetical protein
MQPAGRAAHGRAINRPTTASRLATGRQHQQGHPVAATRPAEDPTTVSSCPGQASGSGLGHSTERRHRRPPQNPAMLTFDKRCSGARREQSLHAGESRESGVGRRTSPRTWFHLRRRTWTLVGARPATRGNRPRLAAGVTVTRRRVARWDLAQLGPGAHAR